MASRYILRGIFRNSSLIDWDFLQNNPVNLTVVKLISINSIVYYEWNPTDRPWRFNQERKKSVHSEGSTWGGFAHMVAIGWKVRESICHKTKPEYT